MYVPIGGVRTPGRVARAPSGPSPDIGKEADTPTVAAGGLEGYRITVTNRGRVTARNWWVCDPIPHRMAFVRSSRSLRRLGGMRCLVIPRLLPHHHASFHLTVRVAAEASGTVTNIAEVIPGNPSGGTPPAKVPIDEAKSAVKVKAEANAKAKPKPKARSRHRVGPAPVFTG